MIAFQDFLSLSSQGVADFIISSAASSGECTIILQLWDVLLIKHVCILKS